MEPPAANSTTPNTTVPRRRWFARGVAWGLFLLFALPLTWVCFAGDIVEDDEVFICGTGGVDLQLEDWEHGWPYVFLNRRYAGPGSSPVEFWGGETWFQGKPFLADLAIYAATMMGLLWFIQPWRTSESRNVFSFSLRAALVGTAVLAMLFANVRHAHLQSQRELEIARHIEESGDGYVGCRYVGPRWFSRFGLNNIVPISTRGIDSIELLGDKSRCGERGEIYQEIAELSSLSRLALSGESFTDEEVGFLLSQRRYWAIESLTIQDSSFTGRPLIGRPPFRNAFSVEFRGTQFNDDGFAAISQWSTLEMVHVAHTRVTAKCIDRAKEMPELSDLTAVGTSITDNDCEPLRQQGVTCYADDPNEPAPSAEVEPFEPIRFDLILQD